MVVSYLNPVVLQFPWGVATAIRFLCMRDFTDLSFIDSQVREFMIWEIRGIVD